MKLPFLDLRQFWADLTLYGWSDRWSRELKVCGLNREGSVVVVVGGGGVDRTRVVRLQKGQRRFEVRELIANAGPVAKLNRNVCDKLNRRNLRVLEKKKKRKMMTFL